MNKHQKIVQEAFIGNEEAVIGRLKQVYGVSLKDINAKAAKLQKEFDELSAIYDTIEDEEEKKILKSRMQSKVYQKKYQEGLKKQVSDILDKMHTEEFKTVSDYLNKCYEDGFIGTMYDLQGQGIPMCFPLDQEAMTRAVQLDSKISQGLYSRLGEDVSLLKKKITAQVSRGIASGMSFSQVAQQLSGYTNIGFNNAVRIARTEGHRIQVQSAMDACYKAKDKGADVVKQWDSTLDGNTRESHAMVDGEIKELDEKFSNGLMFPGDPSGGAAEVVNCRCALLQRARWALDEEELETLKKRAEYFGLDKSENFEEFKQKYLKDVTAPEVKPKKEYLTKKKLEQKISDSDAELANLKDEFKKQSGGWGYDDADKAIAEFEKISKDAAKPFKALKKQIDDIEEQKSDWEEMLNKKIVQAETKKLKKEIVLLQDDLNNFEIKTYSGIWKDDVTTKDWAAKQSSIQKKKVYFEDKLKYATDPDEIKKWKGLLDDLDEFDKKGASYYQIQKKLNKNTADLTNLQKYGKMTPKELQAYTQDRKDAALWAKSTKEADSSLRAVCGKTWQGATKEEKYAIHDYTCGSGKFNRPLAGFRKPYAEHGTGWERKYYKGVGDVWIDYEGAGDEIRQMTGLISKSSYDFDVWLQHGCNGSTMESFLGLPENTFEYMSDSDLQQFVGVSARRGSFMSCGVSKGKGFSSKPVIVNVYAPEGTQMMYAEPFSYFGLGDGLKWDGVTSQSSFGSEAEMIIQRGASFTITKVEKTSGKIYIDMEVHPEQGYDLFQQDDSEWKGSREKGR